MVSTMSTLRTTNKVDGMAQARKALNRISDNVRHASAFGDFYGVGSERLIFPSATNPVYQGGRIPTGGWPVSPWPSPILLNNSTLIVQTPVVYEDQSNDPASGSYSSVAAENSMNGVPLILPKDNFGPSDPPMNLLNFDTTVYSVVPDISRPGEFLLQVARFPGGAITNWDPTLHMPSYKSTINPPQTLAKGIVGPKPLGAGAEVVPAIFSYLIRTQKPGAPSAFFKIDASEVNIADVQGVAVDLEIRSTGTNTGTVNSGTLQSVALHEETFMRSNRSPSLKNVGNSI